MYRNNRFPAFNALLVAEFTEAIRACCANRVWTGPEPVRCAHIANALALRVIADAVRKLGYPGFGSRRPVAGSSRLPVSTSSTATPSVRATARTATSDDLPRCRETAASLFESPCDQNCVGRRPQGFTCDEAGTIWGCPEKSNRQLKGNEDRTRSASKKFFLPLETKTGFANFFVATSGWHPRCPPGPRD